MEGEIFMLNCYIRYRMADKKIDDIAGLMQLSGVSRNSINKLYHGRELETVKLGTFLRLCDALDCSLSDLVEYTREE